MPGGTSRLTPKRRCCDFILLFHVGMKRQLRVRGFAFTCVGDGKASSQVTKRGTGAKAGLSGQGVAVVLSLSTYSTY